MFTITVTSKNRKSINFPMSKALWQQGRTGIWRAQRKPAQPWFESFLMLQMVQAYTYLKTSTSKMGHQKCCLRYNEMVQLAPRWKSKREVWTYWRTWDHAASGTKTLSFGPDPRSGWCQFTSLIAFLISKVRLVIILPVIKIVSGTEIVPSAAKWWERATGLILHEQGE